ncbi:PQQ-binding-like beta-propeller repeat protein [bacterium]|nr:PQQ-binding-like beta-propeller repeat protein [bacterium]
MRTRLICFLLAGMSVLWLSVVDAAIYSGEIEAVSTGTRTITIRIASQDKSMTFQLGPTGRVQSGTKAIQLDVVKVGQIATVTTGSDAKVATKISVRDPKPAEAASKPAIKPTRTEPMPEKSTVSSNVEVVIGDWPQYRGANRDNISLEKGLLTSWPSNGPKVAWEQSGFGEGYSSVSIVGDTIFTLGTQSGQETLFALNRDGGQQKWSISTGRVFQDGGQGNGPRGTPTVDGDRVYALGAHGDLVCAKVADGDVLWRLNILETFQGNNIVWGISESVLIDGEKLICTPGGKAATMVALDKMTGRPIWRAMIPGAPQAGYSSPIAIDVGNVRQYVNFVHTGVVSVRATDGNPLWGQQASANDTANCSSPVAMENLVFTASGYGTGGALFRLASRSNATQSEVVYTTKEMKNHHGGMVLLDGYVYGFDEGILTCLDLKTGKPAWQNRSVGKGSLTYADGRLYLRSEGGPLALCAASPEGYEELGRFDPPNRSNRAAWAHPVVAGGKLYIRDQDTLTVFDVKE